METNLHKFPLFDGVPEGQRLLEELVLRSGLSEVLLNYVFT